MNANIYLTQQDKLRLDELLDVAKHFDYRDRGDLKMLERELRRAVVVDAREVPRDVVTMNSRVEILDLGTGEKMVFTLVFPRDANLEEDKISILAPLGTAIIGYRVGNEFTWTVPHGVRRLKVTNILYQPEAAGDFIP